MTRIYEPLDHDHPMIGEVCPHCNETFKEGELTCLIPDPGLTGRTQVATPMHPECVMDSLRADIQRVRQERTTNPFEIGNAVREMAEEYTRLVGVVEGFVAVYDDLPDDDTRKGLADPLRSELKRHRPPAKVCV